MTGCSKVKALTRAQKLQKVLKACKKNKQCQTKARRQYAPAARKPKSK